MRSLFLTKRNFYIPVSALVISGLSLFGLSACGSEDVTGPETPTSATSDVKPGSSADIPMSQDVDRPTSSTPGASSSSTQKTNSSSSQQSQTQISSSSQAATASSDEILNEPKGVVKGTCGPKTPIIEKGEMATWAFFREEGDVFDAIMAPFVWTFPELDKTLQGNGYNTVSTSYPESGTYNATLSVDGTEIACSPLQVQGIPITISSCKADKETAKAGETITWTVSAESEATITGYSWTSSLGTISGTSTTATLSATADMHKQKVSATVAVTNTDKTTQTYVCDGVTVLDPESVDLVLIVADVNDSKYGEPNRSSLPDTMFIPAQTPITVQIPSNGKSGCNISCVPKVGADYMVLSDNGLVWDGANVSNIGYFSPAGCGPGKKYSVQANVTALCMVSPN